MKHTLTVFALLLTITVSDLYGQESKNDCDDNMRKIAPANIDSLLLARKGSIQQLDVTLPIIIKLFVVVFANSDGSNVAAADSNILRQIDNMRSFYAPRNICFVLGTIRQVNSSTLNSMNASTEEDLLAPYIADGFVTIFIHNTLNDKDTTLNGTAYAIPNPYLSIASDAIASTTNLSTLAHEMGHCFGLYHTFETANGTEHVARSGDCQNCSTNGDYVCDTQADRNVDVSFISSNCVYTGNVSDECRDRYVNEPENIMTYGRRACRTQLSAGQGARARGIIQAESTLTAAIAPDSRTISFGFSSTSGFLNYLARNTVTIDASNNSFTQSAKLVASAKAIVIKPGTRFAPGTDGYAQIVVNPFCN